MSNAPKIATSGKNNRYVDLGTAALGGVRVEYLDYYSRTNFRATTVECWRTRNQPWLNYF